MLEKRTKIHDFMLEKRTKRNGCAVRAGTDADFFDEVQEYKELAMAVRFLVEGAAAIFYSAYGWRRH